MKYFEFTFRTQPCTETVNDVLAAILGEVGFESFVECEGGLTAYIQQTLCDENAIKIAITEFPLPDTDITYTYTEAEDKDWNEEWEKNFFQPIIIGNRCVIHSTFHQDVPKAEYDIVINPQMAFGTGHHETTSLIIEELLDSELKDKSCSIWAAELRFSPSSHVCGAHVPVRPSTLMNGAYETPSKTSN